MKRDLHLAAVDPEVETCWPNGFSGRRKSNAGFTNFYLILWRRASTYATSGFGDDWKQLQRCRGSKCIGSLESPTG